MNLNYFLAESVKALDEEDFFLSQRFKDESDNPLFFRVKPISEVENAEIRKSCLKRVKLSHNQYGNEFDHEGYLARLLTTCCVSPDFHSAELQSSWGCLGAEDLARKMLLPGEYAKLLDKVRSICGFDKDISELRDTLKKE